MPGNNWVIIIIVVWIVPIFLGKIVVEVVGNVRCAKIARRISTLIQLAEQRHCEGAHDEAIRLISQGVHLARHRMGDYLPALAPKLRELGIAYQGIGEYAAAEAMLLWSLGTYRRSSVDVRNGTPMIENNVKQRVQETLDSLNEVYRARGDYGAMESAMRVKDNLDERYGVYTTANSPLNSLRPSLRALFKAVSGRQRSPMLDPVDCMVFARPTVLTGSSFLVQVFVLPGEEPAEADKVRNIATTYDADAQERAAKSLETEVARGARLTFHLSIPGFVVDDPFQSLVWRGTSQSVQFGVCVPRDQCPGDAIGTVTISQDSVPVGHVKFMITVFEAEDSEKNQDDAIIGTAFGSEPVAHAICRYRKAFISYASTDRAEVLKRVQMLACMKIDYFHDLLHLDPGERWAKKLYEHIDSSDLFLLFWSRAARDSEWVMKEVTHAISRKSGDDASPPEILPVIIEGPPPPPPPTDLEHLHFNDYFMYFISAQQLRENGGQKA